MNTTNRTADRLCCGALALAGLVAGATLPFHPDELRPGALLEPAWVPVHLGLLASFVLAVPGLVGLWSVQRERLGPVGHATFLVALVGQALAVGMVCLEVFALPAFAEARTGTIGDLLGPGGPCGAGGALFLAGFATFLPGWAAFGVATARAGLLPPAVGGLVTAGVLGCGIPTHFVGGLGPAIHVLAGLLFGAAWGIAGATAARRA